MFIIEDKMGKPEDCWVKLTGVWHKVNIINNKMFFDGVEIK